MSFVLGPKTSVELLETVRLNGYAVDIGRSYSSRTPYDWDYWFRIDEDPRTMNRYPCNSRSEALRDAELYIQDHLINKRVD